MASKPPDDSRQTPPPADEGQGPAQRGDRRTPAPPPANEPLDFGTFVSRSVRSSADRLRQADSGEASPTQPAEEPSSRPRRERPSRYWRDSVQGDRPIASRRTTRAAETRDATDEGDDGGDRQPPFWASLFGGDNEDGRNRRLLLAFIAGLVAVLLIAFLLTRLIGGGDDNDGDPTPTPTAATTEIVPGGGDAPASTPRTFPTGSQQGAPSPTPTDEVIRGGDNQLGGDQDTDTEGTPAAWAPNPGSQSHAKGTGERPSLVRVVGDAG